MSRTKGRGMIDRKPVQQRSVSMEALRIGRLRCASFRRHIPLEGAVSVEAIRKVSDELGLSSRQVSRLVPIFRENPVPEALAPARPGPKMGTHRIRPDVAEAIDGLIEELYLTKTPPAKALVAHQVRNLLIADNGDYCFPEESVPSERVIERLIGEITETRKAKASKGSKSRSAAEPHPYHYDSNGVLDLVQMDSTRADLFLVDQQMRAPLDRPWLTFLIDVFTRCIIGFYVSFGDPSIYRCGRAVVNAMRSSRADLAGHAQASGMQHGTGTPGSDAWRSSGPDWTQRSIQAADQRARICDRRILR